MEMHQIFNHENIAKSKQQPTRVMDFSIYKIIYSSPTCSACVCVQVGEYNLKDRKKKKNETQRPKPP